MNNDQQAMKESIQGVVEALMEKVMNKVLY